MYRSRWRAYRLEASYANGAWLGVRAGGHVKEKCWEARPHFIPKSEVATNTKAVYGCGHGIDYDPGKFEIEIERERERERERD